MPDFSRSLAVVIGIDRYQNGIPALQTASNDARSVGALLRDKHGYELCLIVDEDATLSRLTALLKVELPAQVGPEDRVFFYFAGHGVALNGDNGPEGFILPQDARRDSADSFIPMPDLHDELCALNCRHLLAILDCCFAGAFRWSSTRDIVPLPSVLHQERYDRFIRDPAWQVISSAAHDEKALDVLLGKALGSRGNVGEHSPFAEVLLEGLSGAGDLVPTGGGDGVITATELYVYLDDSLARKTSDQYHRQTPCLWPLKRHDKGQYIFLAPGHQLNLPPAPELTTATNPYRGLESFGEEHKALFFGRERVIQSLLTHVSKQALTVVLGASGTGKSSLVKAGLVPALRDQGWEVLPIVRPGVSPLKSVAAALAPSVPGSRLSGQVQPITGDFPALSSQLTAWFADHPDRHRLLVVDQMEELVTMCRDEMERDRFLQFLVEAAEAQPHRLRVVLTVRSDFEPQFTGGRLQALWQRGRFVVPPMTQDELREAIERPASERVLYFEPAALVDKLINEVVQMPGALPLLSFTLSEMYVRYLERDATDRALIAADYDALGGVIGALRHRATEELDRLDPRRQATLRRVMLRMVSIAGGDIARRRVPRSELTYPDEAENGRVKEVIARLTEARLLVEGREAEGDPYVEPAHDELVRGWDKLWQWIRAERQPQDELAFQRRLTQAALEWEAVKGGSAGVGLLWQDPSRSGLLESALRSADPWFNRLEHEFARRSVKRRRRNRLMRAGAATAIVLAAVIASIAALVANNQLHQSESRELAGRASRNPEADRVRALVLAIAAARRYPTYEAQEALRSLVQRQYPQALLRHRGVTQILFTPDGGKVLTIGDSTVRIWDVATARQVTTIGSPAIPVDWVAFSPDGRRFLTLGGRKTVRLWETATWRPIAPLQDDTAQVAFVEIGPDGRRIVTVTENARVRLWDAATGQERTPTDSAPASLWAQQGELLAMAYSADSHALLTTGVMVSARNEWFKSLVTRPAAQVWDLETGKLLGTFRPPASEIVYAALSPDARLVLTLGMDSTPRLWDVRSGRQVAALRGHRDFVRYAAFSPDGRQLVTVSDDHTGRLWDVATHALAAVLEGHTDDVEHASFSSDGKLVVTTGRDGTARIWTTPRGQFYMDLRPESREINHAEFSPDRRWILTTDRDGGATMLWRLSGAGAALRASGPVSQATFSPDGQRVASTCGTSSVCLWEVRGERETAVLDEHPGRIMFAEFSPDDRIVATAGDDYAGLWDAKTGRLLAGLGTGRSRFKRVAFDPAGRRVVTAGEDSVVRVWEVPSGREIRRLPGRFRVAYSAVFSPDGSLVLATNDDSTARIWDAGTGRLVTELKGHEGLVLDGGFSPDGKLVVTGGADRTARIWSVADGRQVALLKTAGSNSVERVVFSSDGKWVLTANVEARLWDVARPEEGRLVASRDRMVEAAAFSPDSRRLVTAGWDSTATIRPVDGGAGFTVRHDRRILDAEFSPDGRTVITAGEGVARLWDSESGRQMAELRGAGWPAAFSHDGQRVITPTQAVGGARIFCTDLRCLLELAESRVPLNLTDEERRRMIAR